MSGFRGQSKSRREKLGGGKHYMTILTILLAWLVTHHVALASVCTGLQVLYYAMSITLKTGSFIRVVKAWFSQKRKKK